MTYLMADGSADGPGGGEDERSLVASVSDPTAFADLYDRRFRRVVAFFYRRILCPHTAAELTAETFARAFANRKRFDPSQGTAMGWLMGIAGNLYRQWSHKGVINDRMRTKLAIEMPVLLEDDLEAIERLADLTSLRGALRDALSELTPGLRDAVILRVAQDLPYPEVADRLGCSVGAARVRVSRGLDALVTQMEVRDG